MTKHTPGPWEAIGRGVYAASGREIIFQGHMTRSAEEEEQRANASLIASAPDLLAACIAANRTMTALGDLGDLTYKPLRRAHSAVLYAIDRAEGRDSYHARYDTNLTEAARDLYDALRRLVAACPCDGPEWDAASAAIAKAEGRG